MENPNQPEYTYCKVFLTEPSGKDNTLQGVLEVHQGDNSGEVFGKLPVLPGNRVEYALAVNTEAGQQKLLGKFKRQGGQGDYYLRVKDEVISGACSQFAVLWRPLSSRNKVRWNPLLFGTLGALYRSPEKPGEYLWGLPGQDFPQLLGRLMERVEAITGTLNKLEQRRKSLIKPTRLREVEPFNPPLANYKWWQLTNQ